MLAGRLLVAAPPLHDPNFFRTVVLLLDHDEHGALGLVLNRPGDLTACEVVPRLAALLEDSAILYVGGPVQQDGVIGLAEYRDPATFGAQPVVGPVGVLDADLDADELAEGIARVRAFQGYAGWGPGQLESELAEEAWIVAPAHASDAFDEEPTTLWRRALERLGGPLPDGRAHARGPRGQLSAGLGRAKAPAAGTRCAGWPERRYATISSSSLAHGSAVFQVARCWWRWKSPFATTGRRASATHGKKSCRLTSSKRSTTDAAQAGSLAKRVVPRPPRWPGLGRVRGDQRGTGVACSRERLLDPVVDATTCSRRLTATPWALCSGRSWS